ncbi:transcriptional regulator [Streptomyces sp. SCUT-3]|uniref:transcriptional regulator n=1 Tax=Streptomyces sp. SCUT-3 TaxID=2684469 RepID=UPI000CA8E2E4|nr:transcriptional regulator [Streptomyces sp. SCUT-3]PLW74717.1 transcriptional regulator [Streptomyces sp. DJ]QMV21978.1 transcriptional regulator [Streptomyces sp. SCUT-3]
MSSYTRWQDIRAEHVARAGGEEAVQAGKEEMLAEVTGRRLAELRRARGLTQQEVADRMGVRGGDAASARGRPVVAVGREDGDGCRRDV